MSPSREGRPATDSKARDKLTLAQMDWIAAKAFMLAQNEEEANTVTKSRLRIRSDPLFQELVENIMSLQATETQRKEYDDWVREVQKEYRRNQAMMTEKDVELRREPLSSGDIPVEQTQSREHERARSGKGPQAQEDLSLEEMDSLMVKAVWLASAQDDCGFAGTIGEVRLEMRQNAAFRDFAGSVLSLARTDIAPEAFAAWVLDGWGKFQRGAR